MVRSPRGRPGRGGYTLVALLVGMTVASILIAAVLPLASAQAQRDREAELIFRGLQYAEGIRVFRRRFGRYPNTLQELLEAKPRSVRKLWKDPMTPDGTWGIVSLEGSPIAPRDGSGAGGSRHPADADAPSQPDPDPRERRSRERTARSAPWQGSTRSRRNGGTGSGRAARPTTSGVSRKRASRARAPVGRGRAARAGVGGGTGSGPAIPPGSGGGRK